MENPVKRTATAYLSEIFGLQRQTPQTASHPVVEKPVSDEDQFKLIVEGVDERFEHDGRRPLQCFTRCRFRFISNSSEMFGIFRELQIRPTRCGTP
jgi:hypothetical protein